MDDINPLDVAVAYVSVLNKSKTIKCVSNLLFGDILLMGVPMQEHHFDHNIKFSVVVRWS